MSADGATVCIALGEASSVGAGSRVTRASSQYTASTGDSVRETSSEISIAAEMVMPKGRKNCPSTPLIRPMGRNTATTVSVAAVTVRPISSVALMAASRGDWPMSRCRAMFSRSTIASSTTLPTIIASASSVMVSRLKPYSIMTMAVPSSEVGIASAEIAVARQFQRNGKITRAEITTASARACSVWRVAARM